MKKINLLLCLLSPAAVWASDVPSMREAIAAGNSVVVNTHLFLGADPCELVDGEVPFDGVIAYMRRALTEGDEAAVVRGRDMLSSLVEFLFTPGSLSRPSVATPEQLFLALCSSDVGRGVFKQSGIAVTQEVLLEALLQYADAGKQTIGASILRVMGCVQSPTSVTEV